jgi:DNA-binding NtrC family response regulator
MARICRVLVVEDRDAVRELVAGAVAHAGYRFSLAADAQAMRDELQRNTIDAVVVDVDRDDCDRLELADEAREEGIAVVLTTGDHRLADDDRRGHRLVRKPYKLVDLVQAIEAALEDVRATCARSRRRSMHPLGG